MKHIPQEYQEYFSRKNSFAGNGNGNNGGKAMVLMGETRIINHMTILAIIPQDSLIIIMEIITVIIMGMAMFAEREKFVLQLITEDINLDCAS